MEAVASSAGARARGLSARGAHSRINRSYQGVELIETSVHLVRFELQDECVEIKRCTRDVRQRECSGFVGDLLRQVEEIREVVELAGFEALRGVEHLVTLMGNPNEISSGQRAEARLRLTVHSIPCLWRFFYAASEGICAPITIKVVLLRRTKKWRSELLKRQFSFFSLKRSIPVNLRCRDEAVVTNKGIRSTHLECH